MKKVVISGYYGFNNAGDEAILAALVAGLRREAARRGEELKITVLSASPAETAARHKVAAVGRMNIWQIIRELSTADLFLSGGGGLLQDRTGQGLSVAYYLGLVFLARLLGKPAVLYAHGIGPVKRACNRLLVRLVANRAAQVSVRDEASLAELVAMGVTRPPVEVTADPAFLLSPAEKAENKNKRPVFAVAVRPGAGEEKYLPEIAAAADRLQAKYGAELVLLPMHPACDLPATRRLAGMLQAKAAVLSEIPEPEKLLDRFAGFDLVISLRLHALIFAAICGVPMVGIGYDPKVDAFLRLLELDVAGDTLTVQADYICRQAEERLAAGQALREELLAKREMLRRQAEGTLGRLAAVLFESGEEHNRA